MTIETRCPGCGLMIPVVFGATVVQDSTGTTHLKHEQCGFGVRR